MAGGDGDDMTRLGEGGRGGLVFLTSEAVASLGADDKSLLGDSSDGIRGGFVFPIPASSGSRGGLSSGRAACGRSAEGTNLPGGGGNL